METLIQRNNANEYNYKRSYICTVENDMKTWLIMTIIHTTYAVAKANPKKNSGLNGIQTHDLCNTSAVLYQLSYMYQVIRELVT